MGKEKQTTMEDQRKPYRIVSINQFGNWQAYEDEINRLAELGYSVSHTINNGMQMLMKRSKYYPSKTAPVAINPFEEDKRGSK